jgi:hypothetical protein
MSKPNVVSILIALGVWLLVLQNAGLIPSVKTVHAQGVMDVNIHSVVGRQLVESKKGMHIGVSSTGDTIIPVHWGEITVVP